MCPPNGAADEHVKDVKIKNIISNIGESTDADKRKIAS